MTGPACGEPGHIACQRCFPDPMMATPEGVQSFVRFVQAAMDEAAEEARQEAAKWKRGVEDANKISQRFEAENVKLRSRIATLEAALREIVVLCGDKGGIPWQVRDKARAAFTLPKG